jgi:hypothetical protein
MAAAGGSIHSATQYGRKNGSTAVSRGREHKHGRRENFPLTDEGDRIEADVVRQRVRNLLAADRLPGDVPTRMWGGAATGLSCCCCSEPIDSGTEYELDFRDSPGWRFHPRCYEIWHEERPSPGESKADISA